MIYKHELPPPQPRDCVGWIRLRAAAKMAGLSPEMLARGCATGEIPVALRQYGPRLHFLHYGQLTAWLGIPAERCTADDLARARQLPQYEIKFDRPVIID